jgi:hypothetical protein
MTLEEEIGQLNLAAGVALGGMMTAAWDSDIIRGQARAIIWLADSKRSTDCSISRRRRAASTSRSCLGWMSSTEIVVALHLFLRLQRSSAASASNADLPDLVAQVARPW